MEKGVYEELITEIINNKLLSLSADHLIISKETIQNEEAAAVISRHLYALIKNTLDSIPADKENGVITQINLANEIISLLEKKLKIDHLNENHISGSGQMLKSILSRIDPRKDSIKDLTPYSGLTNSDLFTGGISPFTLESELRKEIATADRIDLLVSFIKFKGIIILEKELQDFAARGGYLRVMTTTYMGASDYKAIQRLSQIPNAQVKISYNTGNERLHAKAYLFFRNTGFHTGYIGSSNFSRTALTDGLEWNVKVTNKEVNHLITKFQRTFDIYWNNDQFELFDAAVHSEKLKLSLNEARSSGISGNFSFFFEVKPYPFQEEILEKLEVERSIHQRFRNLIVAATGTGKTIISAFDFKKFKSAHNVNNFLFLAHRKEILFQALATYRSVLRDNNFGEIWADGEVPEDFRFVFATVQTLNYQLKALPLKPDHFAYIVVDECHHLTANSYQGIIQYFTPKILLGLTATPERMDGGDIQEDFHHRIAAEIRLPEALNRKLLCPFQYFGIADSVDLSEVSWVRGKYDQSELSALYTKNIQRVGDILNALNEYTKDLSDVRALGFCVSMDHAQFMAKKFNDQGYSADCLTSADTRNRDRIKNDLVGKKINYLFVVDIYNEGVDIPEVDVVLFLRPTESLTIFLQQLGRGLRLSEGKECLTVLDFVGNARPEYSFEDKFRALVGKTNTPVHQEIAANFPHLPLGCSIILEKKAKEVILKNISEATQLGKIKIIQKIRSFSHHTHLPLTLKHFIDFYNVPLQSIYKHGSWKGLCSMAGVEEGFEEINEKEIQRAIRRKWLVTKSTSYLTFILQLAREGFNPEKIALTPESPAMLLMLYYDVWREPGKFPNLESGIKAIGNNPLLVSEIIELLEILIDSISHREMEMGMPIKVYSQYTRDQILSALEISTFSRKFPSREGVVEVPNKNMELLFINLRKSEKSFTPSTMYNDYVISEHLFHWQTQNSAGPDTPKGLSYIQQEKNKKRIFLFVREKSKDEYDNTLGFLFAGEVKLKKFNGAKPMNIIWELSNPLPSHLLPS